MSTDTILLRFSEQFDDVLPSDTSKQLEDLNTDGAIGTLPVVGEGFTGYARIFSATDSTRLQAVDRAAGDTTLTRTMSVQAILRFDYAAQAAAGTPGTIVCRGKSGSADERVAYALELRVVNLGTRTIELRYVWQDIAGVEHTCVGGWFVAPVNGTTDAFLMVTATRRWISSSEVVCRYYIGEQLLGEFVETVGDIGGGTLGTTTIGARYAGAWEHFFCGAIDELRVVDYELAPEEIQATWLRISEYQPLGVQLYIDEHPPGWFPSFDSNTRHGREALLIGNGLGYAAAQIENFRANMMPDRAYGHVLERWESITGVEQRHGDGITERRRRVLARMRQRLGVSPDGVKGALEELLATSQANIDVIAFSNIIEDDFTTLKTLRWQTNPSAKWSIVGGALQVSTNDSAGTFPYDWRTCLTGVDGPDRIGGYGAQAFVKVTPTTLADGGEVGVCLYDKVRKDALLLGVRRVGAAYQVVSQRYTNGVSLGVTVHAVTANVPHWLHVGADPTTVYSGQAQTDLVPHFVRWSTTSATAGFTQADPGNFDFVVGWCGFYARGYDGGANINGNALIASWDDAALWFPHGGRPFYFYALREAGLPGDYDLSAATTVLSKLKQAHTHACAITSLALLCDDPDSGCGLGPCGGI